MFAKRLHCRELAVILGIEKQPVNILAALLAFVTDNTILALEIIPPRVLTLFLLAQSIQKKAQCDRVNTTACPVRRKRPLIEIRPEFDFVPRRINGCFKPAGVDRIG